MKDWFVNLCNSFVCLIKFIELLTLYAKALGNIVTYCFLASDHSVMLDWCQYVELGLSVVGLFSLLYVSVWLEWESGNVGVHSRFSANDLLGRLIPRRPFECFWLFSLCLLSLARLGGVRSTPLLPLTLHKLRWLCSALLWVVWRLELIVVHHRVWALRVILIDRVVAHSGRIRGWMRM